MKYQQVKDGEVIKPFLKNYKIMCCDCGLTHVLNFTINDGELSFTARRDYRATAAARRGKKGVTFKR